MNEFKLTRLGEAAILTMGWVMAKHGVEADPVRWLAEALTAEGAKFPHLDRINAELAGLSVLVVDQPEIEEHA